jgi:aspartate-semialdehyde dehydrogenase
MPADRHSQRITIAGASSLLGNELKSLLEESRFAGWDLRLVDEDAAAGLLTEAGGEAAVVQKVEEDTFRGAHFAFLAGSRDFGKKCIPAARSAGAAIIDFTGATLGDAGTVPWFPQIETLTGRAVVRTAKTFSILSAGAMAVASLSLALRPFQLRRMVVELHQSASEAGRQGIEELEVQTSRLLTFQSIGHGVFGTQSAFNMLPRFGSESHQDLQRSLLEMRAGVSAALADPVEDNKISLNLMQAPVFYGTTFGACADLGQESHAEKITEALINAGFSVVPTEEPGPSNISVAGETILYVRTPRPDSSSNNSWWFWGAGDNLRVPAWCGVKLADWLYAS